MNDRRGSFVDRVLDGHALLEDLEAEVATWAGGARRRPLHEVLGLDARELDLVASTPDALRYVLHARRFGRATTPEELASQRRVRELATRIASEVFDPFELAELEAWMPHVDRRASGDGEPAHA
ncbi:MAG: hypothetical protein JWM98_2567 [Thermoleophilia bacterium]|nr:hypothetical protein [Thermoleophilia bacterium]